MKKLLFMLPNLSHGGAEKVLVNLVNNLNSQKYDITVMTLFDVGINRQFLLPHIHYKYVFKKTFPANCKILSLFSPKFLHKLFIKENYDMEISYLEGPTSRIVSGVKQIENKKNIPTVAWIHISQRDLKTAVYAFCCAKEAKNCYNSFDRIVCVSKTVADDFQSIFSLEKEPVVLYNTVESNKILEKASEEVTDVEFSETERNIIAVGTLKQVKGFERLINIHKKLRDSDLPVHLYFLGEGPDKDLLKEQTKKFGIDDSVTFLGYKTNPYKYVKKCDLFVCSSYAEGFSTAATEALIVGTPVCTTLVSGMKEMLGDNNEYGVVTENSEEALFNGIYRMLTEPELLKHYTKKAEERGKFFSTEKTVQEVEKFLDNLKG